MTRSSPWILALFCVALAACGRGERPASAARVEPDAPWFVDVTEGSGLDFVHVYAHQVRYWMPEISAGGLAFLDYDGDGWLDVYCVQSGDIEPEPGRELERNRLFRNGGDGTFREVTDVAGVGDHGYGHGCATGDFDGDGHVDLFVANLRGDVLYRNNGDGSFTDVTEQAGVRGTRWSTACAFLDSDGDGLLDLFVVHNLNWSPAIEIQCRSAHAELDYCSPKNYNAPSSDTLFRNQGDGTFRDVSEEAGLTAATGIGLGVAVADFDGDGHVDVYVANDSVPNVLWMNDGKGRFVNRALELGCAVNMSGASEAGMGVQAVDIDGDGDFDLFLTHLRDETNTFYRNTGGVFADQTPATGLSTPSRKYTGFGMGFHDFDHDGVLDLFVGNGRVDLWRPYHSDDEPYAEPNQLFRGKGGGVFEELPGGPARDVPIGSTRAVAFGDFDNDGAIDVLYLDLGGHVRLLRNVAPKRGGWIGFRVLNAHGSDALGAVVQLDTSAGSQYRLCHTSYSYCAANDPRVHFGLGDARVEGIVVTWPGGRRERFSAHAPESYHVLRQGTGEPVSD